MRVTTEGRRTDVVCLAVLVLAGIALRLPSLNRVAINPDESQYEAIASYLVGSGQSAFAVPHASGGTYALFKLFALVFGPYSTFEMRVFVALLSLLIAIGTYMLVRRPASPWASLAAGLVFLHYNLYSEGLSINREWFSIPCLLGASLLYASWARSGPPRPRWQLFACGLVASCALWFKLQAVFMLPAVPLALAWQSYSEGNVRGVGRAWVTFSAGCLTGVGIYLSGFALAGTLGDYLGSVWTDWSVYTMGNTGHERISHYFQHLYNERPFRPVLTLGLAAAAASVILAFRSRDRATLALASPTAVLCAGWLAMGLVTVSLGGRFFDHYFLFLVFPVAALIGFSLHDCCLSRNDGRSLDFVALAFCLILIVDRVRSLAALSPARIVEQWPASAPAALYFLIAAGVITAIVTRGLGRARGGAAVLIAVEITVLVALGQTWQMRHADAEAGRKFESLVGHLETSSRRGDRLFVWGWAPEIYSLTRLEAASHVTIGQYVVGDTAVVDGESRLQPAYAEELMLDLRKRRPRFVVDAARRSWTLQEDDRPWIYDLERYPEFELNSMLRSDYDQVGEFDACRVFRRREPARHNGDP